MHAAGMIALRHFLMDDPAACRHPLHVASRDGPAIPHTVAVLYGSGQDICDGFDAAVRVPGKTRQIIFRNVIAEVIEEKKGIEIGSVTEAERTAEVPPRAFHRRLRGYNSFNRPERHW